jgi:hypothetical protein
MLSEGLKGGKDQALGVKSAREVVVGAAPSAVLEWAWNFGC